MQQLRKEVYDENTDLDLVRRGKAVGFALSDTQLVRWFVTSNWKLEYPDGNTVAESIASTVAWREKKGIWQYTTDRRKRETFAPALQGGLFFSVGFDRTGRPPMWIRPAQILAVAERDLKLVPDLVLYTMERAELAAIRAGNEGAGVVVYLDCKDCSLNTLRRFATAALPSFSELATHYPDRLEAVRILNSNGAAAFVYKVCVAPFMTPATRAKIRFVDGDQTEATLLRELGPSALQLAANFEPRAYLAREC
jgi:hypothetical protein